MKKTLSVLLCLCTLLLCLATTSACSDPKERRREDGSLYLEGTYVSESGIGDRVFVFTKDLLVMIQVINEETLEFHYDYEIRENEDEMTLLLTYKNHVYEGRSGEVLFYLNGMILEYNKNPTLESAFDMGDGYIVVSGKKLVLK